MVFSGVIHGKAYKCDENGKTTYQKIPCMTEDNLKVLSQGVTFGRIKKRN